MYTLYILDIEYSLYNSLYTDLYVTPTQCYHANNSTAGIADTTAAVTTPKDSDSGCSADMSSSVPWNTAHIPRSRPRAQQC